MASIFGDLTYNTKTLKPIGRPVDDLKALYKDKKDDYNYVIDSLNATETALNQVQFIDKDKWAVDNANNKYQETFNKFSEEGDFENKIVDTKRLANDLTNKYGLLRVQENAKTRSAYIASLQAKVDKGEMPSEKMQKLVSYSDRNYGGVQKNETTGGFTGSYSGRIAQPYVPVAEHILKYVNGIKSSTIPIKNSKGEEELLIRDPNGKGYLTATTKEFVSEAQVQSFAKSIIESNDLIQSQFNEDIFLEIDEKGKGGLSTSDIQKALKGRVTDEIKNYFGVTKLPSEEEIDKIIAEKGITKEEAYAKIRKEQLADTAMEAAVTKESFVKYDTKFLEDWEAKEDAKGKKAKAEDDALMFVNKLGTVQRISPEDMTQLNESITTTKNSLQTNYTNLKNIKTQLEADKKEGKESQYTPQEVIELERNITQGNTQLENLERQKSSISNFVQDKAGIDTKFHYGVYESAVDTKRHELKNKYLIELEEADKILKAYGKPVKNSASDRNAIAWNKAVAETPKKSEKEYHDEAIFKYTQGDTGSFSVNSSSTDFDDSTRYVAKLFKGKIGDLKHQDITQDVYTLNSSDTTSKAANVWNAYVENMNLSLAQNPANFTHNGQDITTLVETELDIKWEDVDRSKLKVNPVIELLNGKPAYSIEVTEYKKADKNPSLPKRILVNFEGGIEQDETVKRIAVLEASKYLTKVNNGTLSGHDEIIFGKLAESYIGSSEAGRNLDNLNLYTAEPNVSLEWKLSSSLAVSIVPKKYKSKEEGGQNQLNDLVYEMHNKQGKVYGKDKSGNDVWDYANNLKEVHLFDSPMELKRVMGSALLTNELNGTNTTNTNSSPVSYNPAYQQHTNIDVNVVVKTESNGNASAVNTKSGATGLMQILPLNHELGSPLKDWNAVKGNPQYTDADMKDPAKNKEVGTWNLNTNIPKQLASFNLPDNAMYRLMAYNWGIGNVKEWHQKGANWEALPDETKNYIKQILG